MTVEGLKPGTTYVFRVRARTDGVYGNYGGEIELETSHEGETKVTSTNTDLLLKCGISQKLGRLIERTFFDTPFCLKAIVSNTNINCEVCTCV